MRDDPIRFPKEGLVRLNQVLSVFPISRAGWWAGVKSGKYPQSIKHGGCTFWRASDIHELIEGIKNDSSNR